jgi:hypothetical protein
MLSDDEEVRSICSTVQRLYTACDVNKPRCYVGGETSADCV